MEKRTLGRTNLEVSVLGFGGAPVGILETEQQRVGEILDLLLDEGVNLIDTAASYRGSEELIGRTVGHRRGEYVLVSKCGQSFPDLPGAEWSAEVIRATVDRALQRLQTDYLDVMLLHSCGLDVLQRGEALGALVEAREAGKIRFAGYSGDNEEAAYAASLPDVAVVETSVNICDQRNLDVVLPVTQQANLGVIAKRPIANAAWKDLGQQPGFYAEYARTYTERLAQMNLDPRALGLDSAQAWPELALRFTLSQPGVQTAIIGTTNPQHVRTNLEAARQGPLPEETVEAIRVAFRRAEATAGSSWRGEI